MLGTSTFPNLSKFGESDADPVTIHPDTLLIHRWDENLFLICAPGQNQEFECIGRIEKISGFQPYKIWVNSSRILHKSDPGYTSTRYWGLNDQLWKSQTVATNYPGPKNTVLIGMTETLHQAFWGTIQRCKEMKQNLAQESPGPDVYAYWNSIPEEDRRQSLLGLLHFTELAVLPRNTPYQEILDRFVENPVSLNEHLRDLWICNLYRIPICIG